MLQDENCEACFTASAKNDKILYLNKITVITFCFCNLNNYYLCCANINWHDWPFSKLT